MHQAWSRYIIAHQWTEKLGLTSVNRKGIQRVPFELWPLTLDKDDVTRIAVNWSWRDGR